MKNKTTIIIAAVVFVLVGTLVFAAIAPYLSNGAHATRISKPCAPNSPQGRTGTDGLGCSIASPRVK